MDPNTSRHAPLPKGSDVGGSDIARTLGFSTFGIVYRAEGHLLKDPVAIKEFFRGISPIASTPDRLRRGRICGGVCLGVGAFRQRSEGVAQVG